MAAASEAEGPRSLDVGSDPCMTLTDLGQLVLGMKYMEHRSMPFLSRLGTLMGARDDARIRRSGAPPAQENARNRQDASGHTARGASPAIFTLVSNIDMGTSFRVEAHHDARRRCGSNEFREFDPMSDALHNSRPTTARWTRVALRVSDIQATIDRCREWPFRSSTSLLEIPR